MTEEIGFTVKEYYESHDSKVPDYFVMQMSILENLPEETQCRFVAIIEEIEDTFDMSDVPTNYQVMARGVNPKSKMGPGAFIQDPFKTKCPPKFRK